MAAVEDIVSVILLIAIFLAGSVVMVQRYSTLMLEKETFLFQYEIEEKYGSTLDSLLEVTEGKSQRSFGELMGSAAYYRTETIRTDDGTVEIAGRFGELLDLAFPDTPHSFSVTAPVSAIKLHFIVDGSATMHDEAASLKQKMNQLLSELSRTLDINVSARIYVLNKEESGWCNSSPVACSYLGPDFLYYNESCTTFDLRKHKYGYFKPFNFDDEEEVWQSDWETALALLALTTDNSNLSSAQVLLPVSDGLPGATQYFYPCPRDYAFQVISRDFTTLRRTNFIIDPIFSTNSDPILYCDQSVIEYMDSIARASNGAVIENRDNFMTQLPGVLRQNLLSSELHIGSERPGKQVVLSRYLPMPNGGLAIARLHLYQP